MIQTVILSCLFLPNILCANVLGFFPYPSISHQEVFQPIWKKLSLNGHNVTVITPNPLKESNLTNLTEINTSFAYDLVRGNTLSKLFGKDTSSFTLVETVLSHTLEVLEYQLKYEQVKQIISNCENQYDVILIEAHFVPLIGLAGKCKAPLILLSSVGVFSHLNNMIGNIRHPILDPDFFLPYSGKNKLSFIERLHSFLFATYNSYFYTYRFMPKCNKFAQKYFGDIPLIEELVANVSLLMSSKNPIIYKPTQALPTVVEISQMHLKSKKKLPNDLKNILDNSPEGMVYFSLGSNVKSSNLSDDLRRVISEALGELPYKVLWKWENDEFVGKPANVITRKWLPQQDVLGHPNIKVFVTQGGLQSIEEAIDNTVPLVGLPFIADQPLNILKLEEYEVAIGLDPAFLTKDQLKNAIVEVAENPKYRNKMKELKVLVEDQPMTGLEKAIWWCEYVIRHKGAKHLQSPALTIPLYQYLLLDVLAATILVLFIVTYTICKIYQWLKRIIFKRGKLKSS